MMKCFFLVGWYCVNCIFMATGIFSMQVSRRTEEKETEAEIDTLELKTGEKIKVFDRGARFLQSDCCSSGVCFFYTHTSLPVLKF